MKKFTSVNPFNQSVISEYAVFSDETLEGVLEKSEKSFNFWKDTDFQFRANLMLNVAHILRNNIDLYANTISLEMGKILKESRSEIEKCAMVCDYYAAHAETMLKEEIIETDANLSKVVYSPIGCVFAIMPWNFPFWQVFRFAAPCLMAGNSIILKHAKNVCACSLQIENIFREAGFPEHVFQSVIIETDQIEKIIKHNIVQGITLNGSENAGSSVAALAGKHIKRTVLELGGSDAFIVLKDANIKNAVKIALLSRFQNAGQSCIAAKRFIVDKHCKDEFLSAMEAGIVKIKQGD